MVSGDVGVGSSIRAKTGEGSFSFTTSSRVLPSVGLGSGPARSFFSFSFSFFFDLTPALLNATSNCLDDTPRTGRPLLGPVEDWPECDGPEVEAGVDPFPCAGESYGWWSGLGCGGCFWVSCLCDGLRGSLGGLGGGFAFGMIVGMGVAAFAGVFLGVWDAAALACFWAIFFAFLLGSAGGLGFATSLFLASRLDGGMALLITD